MHLLSVRKCQVLLEDIFRDMDQELDNPTRKVTVAAVIKNPFAGVYRADLEPLYDLGKDVGGYLADKGINAIGVSPDQIEAYGKGAIVGIDGEIEHAAAILHPRFGAPVRAAVGKGDDIIPSTKKVGGPGSSLLFPITNKDRIWDFDRMDASEISIADAPKPDEILVALGLAIGGRPLHRTNPDV